MTAPDSVVLQAAERLFEDKCSNDELSAADRLAWRDSLWQEIEAFGLGLALVGEERGGLDIPVPEAFAMLRLAGRVALPLPIAETMVANRLLASAGLAPMSGPATLAPGDAISFAASSDGWTVKGTAERVPWGRHAATVVAIVPNGGDPRVVRITQDALSVTPATNLAHEPNDRLAIDGRLAADAVAPLPSALDASEPVAIMAAARCCQMAGAMERIAEMTIGYALERQQFGRPIAKFQAVQQNLAFLAEQVAASRAAAEMAAEAVAVSPARRLAVASAKVRVGEAAGIVAGLAHQVHGAMGFTHEYPLHHLTRRLWAWREEYGNEAVWAAEIGRRLTASGSPDLWAAITAM